MAGMGSLYSSSASFGFKANAAYPERRLHFSQSDKKNDRDGQDDAHGRANNMTAPGGKMSWPTITACVQNLSLRKHMQS
jgi:hypothetical protein